MDTHVTLQSAFVVRFCGFHVSSGCRVESEAAEWDATSGTSLSLANPRGLSIQIMENQMDNDMETGVL